MIYIYSYQWQRTNMSAPRIETDVTRRHPILEFVESRDRNPQEHHVLLWYHAIGDEQLGDIELQKLLDYSLDENSGELVAPPERNTPDV